MINIEITEDISNQWKDFMKYHQVFSKMVELGVFEKDNISVTLYFDKFSSIRAIDKTKRITLNDKKCLQIALN